MSVQQLLQHIRELPLDEYADLVNSLNREEDYGLDAALQRDEELEAGTTETLSRDEVFSRARSALR